MSGNKPTKNTNNNPQKINLALSRQTTWSGPIPPPEILAEFEKIVPGSAKLIIETAHDQTKHRMGLENHAVTEGFKKAKRGQAFGFILGVSGLIASVVLGLYNHDALAGTVAGISMGTLAIVLVIGRDRQRKNLEEKNPKQS